VETEIAATPPSRLEQEVDRAKELIKKHQFAEALEITEAILAAFPEDRDALYLGAVSQRHMKCPQDALATLARLEEAHPDYGRLFQERGYCLRTLADLPAAITAFEQAVAHNSALPASWRNLGDLYRAAERPADAEHVATQLQHLSQLPPVIVTASSLMNEGHLYKAEQMIRPFLIANPLHLDGMRLLAELGVKLNVLDDAELLLETCVEMAPDHLQARFEYARVLNKRQKFPKALAQAEILCTAAPHDRAFRTLRAMQCVGVGAHQEALDAFNRLLAEQPNDPEMHVSVGHVLKTLGRYRNGIEAYRTACTQKPDYGEAFWSLANLKTYRFTDQELAQMRTQEVAHRIRPVDRYHLCFALGKALEDRGEYEESFTYYTRGNSLKQQEVRYESANMECDLALQRKICTTEFFRTRAGVGCERPDPIFIVGLPRAGSTLLEQILASHSKVEGTMELPNILELVHRLGGTRHVEDSPQYPMCLPELERDQFRTFGEEYIRETRPYRKDAPFFIDKMPNNFRHIGLIHLILPNAKIIDARRDAMACCFSNFKQLWAMGQDFSYGLEEIGRYYRAYVKLMAHWDAVLPGRVLRMQYEDVIDDLESTVRRILDLCELEFEPACIEFYKTERSVRTASSEQVRQPIFREGLDQWRHFEAFLGPLRAALGPLGEQ
jgi:tetratricopeptide (TPR) repeat protein